MNPSYEGIQVFGAVDGGLDAVSQALAKSGVSGVRELSGDFVAVVSQAEATTLVSSRYGAFTYFYSIANGKFTHGETVWDVIAAAGIPWQWNWRAIVDIIMVDHTLEDETVHPDVRRLPAGAIVEFTNRLRVDVDHDVQVARPGNNDPEAALVVMNRLLELEQPVVSMSAGFDSRAILSGLIANGIRPQLVTAGLRHSTDVQVARSVADAYGLPLEWVDISAEKILGAALDVVRLTGGAKFATHWHTYVYPREATVGFDRPFLIGSNGELARTFFCDLGGASLLLNRMSSEALLRQFWTRKLARRQTIFHSHEQRLLVPGFQQELTLDAQRARVERLVALSGGRFLDGLDRFYLHQRVRNFIGYGLALYRASASPMTPFMHGSWVEAIWGLARPWKLGARWHRWAIAMNDPRLLDIANAGLSHSPPALYWMRKSTVRGYTDYASWFATPAVFDFVQDRSAALDGIVEAPAVGSVLMEHRGNRSRTRAVETLLTLVATAVGAETFVRKR